MSEDVTPARDDIQLSTVSPTAAGEDTVNSAGQLPRNSGKTLGSPIPAEFPGKPAAHLAGILYSLFLPSFPQIHSQWGDGVMAQGGRLFLAFCSKRQGTS